ncbi:hypothetical protein EJ110_NYTH19555 [Nymphaea thermarum]|nr:hypothetical protein EJ110_NYTH19555 [Nymphaea thermarum]
MLILLDCGATYNFLNVEAAQRCQIPLEPSKPQTMIVGNGQRIACVDASKDIEVMIQNKPFKIDLLVLPVDGADLILGLTWLATLGVVAWDFKNLKMTFTQEGDSESVTLTGLASTDRPKAALKALTLEQPAYWLEMLLKSPSQAPPRSPFIGNEDLELKTMRTKQ